MEPARSTLPPALGSIGAVDLLKIDHLASPGGIARTVVVPSGAVRAVHGRCGHRPLWPSGEDVGADKLRNLRALRLSRTAAAYRASGAQGGENKAVVIERSTTARPTRRTPSGCGAAAALRRHPNALHHVRELGVGGLGGPWARACRGPGPETSPSTVEVTAEAPPSGFVFAHGASMPHLPISRLVNTAVVTAHVTSRELTLGGEAWGLPGFDTAEDFVNRLVRRAGMRPAGARRDRGRSPTGSPTSRKSKTPAPSSAGLVSTTPPAR